MRESSPSTSKATPPARTSSGARYQIRRVWILAGGAASGTGTGPGPPSPGAGVIGVAIVPSLINAHPGGPDCHQQGHSWFIATHFRTKGSGRYTTRRAGWTRPATPSLAGRGQHSQARPTRPGARYTQCWLLLRLRVAGGWRGDPDATGMITRGPPAGRPGRGGDSWHSTGMDRIWRAYSP